VTRPRRRPVVGITAAQDEHRTEHQSIREDYVRAVLVAGGLPLVVPSGRPDLAPACLERLDGLLLSGGPDIDPALYGAEPHPRLRRVDRERDEFDLALVREALAADLPILAICRGHQVLNVAMGGTLVQDLASELEGGVLHDGAGDRTDVAHEVSMAAGSRLARAIGRERVPVNSLHHQAVARLGQGLRVTARAVGDDVVEGIELEAAGFAVGVQWHPEAFRRLPEVAAFAVVPAFIAACQARAQRMAAETR
jgi:putative glutamine amidotransferase